MDMSSTFSTGTRVTLWFPGWTTTTTATYVLTIFFLFLLGIFNRFLGALKSQLERRWKAQRGARDSPTHAAGVEKLIEHGVRRHTRQWSRALRPQPARLEEQDGQEIEPLRPAPQPYQAEEQDVQPEPHATRGFWVANAPWSLKPDGIRAVLEFTRALIGYVLYVLPSTTRNQNCQLTLLQNAGCHDVQYWLLIFRHRECACWRVGLRAIHTDVRKPC